MSIMKFLVFSFICKQHKILNSVVIFNAVNVMNSLFGFKVSPKIPFHHKSMLQYVPLFITKRMRMTKNENISCFRFVFSTLPIRMIFSYVITLFEPPLFSTLTKCMIFLKTEFRSKTLKSFIPSNLTYLRNIMTFFRAIFASTYFNSSQRNKNLISTNFTYISYAFRTTFSEAFFRTIYLTWSTIKFFFTHGTNFFNGFKHISSIIKKAVFSDLKETVRFLRLLTAKVSDTINPFLSSNNSIAYLTELSI